MKNVMLDLETMGNRPRSAICAIGAVFFDPTGLGPEFYVRVDLESCVRAGLRLDTSTVLWWLAQEDAARREIHDASLPRLELREALGQLTDFLSVNFDGNLSMWGNGSDFDNVLTVDAYEAVGLEPPWKFWSHRCYRTLKSLRPDVRIPRKGTHHNALDDAKSQALHAIDLAKSLNLVLQ